MQRLLLLLPLWITPCASAFEVVPDFWPQPELPPTEARVIKAPSTVTRELAQVDDLVDAEAYDEAVDLVVRLVGESSEELLPIGDDYFIPAAQAASARVAAWPAKAIAAYRGRVDVAAASLLAAGRVDRDVLKLHEVTDRYLMSSHGDDALLTLADLALEAGEYSAARGYLLQISPDLQQLSHGEQAKPDSRGLVYPDSDVPLSSLLARLAMVSIRSGSLDQAAQEAAILEEKFPDAVGMIGGREANLSKAVNDTLAAARSWPAARLQGSWSTSGGATSRSTVAPPRGDISRIEWQMKLTPPPVHLAPLQRRVFINGLQVPGRQSLDPTLNFIEPLVSGNTIVLENDGKWIALDAKRGKPLFGEKGLIVAKSDLAKPRPRNLRPLILEDFNRPPVLEGMQIQFGGPIVINQGEGRLLLGGDPFRPRMASATIPSVPMAMLDGRLLYAVLTDTDDPSPAERRGPRPNRLVALDLAAEGKLRLEIEPQREERISGPPVVIGPRVYLTLREIDSGGRMSIACYVRSTGRQLWQTPVCSISDQGLESPADTLIAGDGMLFHSTSAGLIVAVRASDGQIAWARSYQRGHSTQPNDLSQVVARSRGACALTTGGLVCAPVDSAAMFCLEPMSGRVLWVNSEAYDVEQILGTAGGRLVCSGRQLWMLDPTTGRTVFAWPDTLVAETQGAGRGCLAGYEVFWPTQRAIHVVSAVTGQKTRNPINLKPLGSMQGANVVPCGDGLLVATEEKLTLLGDEVVPKQEKKPREPVLGMRSGFMTAD